MATTHNNTVLKKQSRGGFTLIELLVVISIIGILAGVLVVGINPLTQMKKARDTRRESDLNQYRNALENYASVNNSFYPVATNAGPVSNICSNLLNGNFISACLSDPVGGSYVYNYWSDGMDYRLWGSLEMGGFWEISSDGRSGKLTSPPVIPTPTSPPVIPTPTSPPVIPTPTPTPTPTSPPVIPTSSPVGTTCTNDSDCSSGYCYRDADGDRYAPASGTKTCQANSQLAGTDCCDTDATTRPGQTSYFIVANKCGTFDYNCDGVVIKGSACENVGTCSLSGACGMGCGGGTSSVAGNCTTGECGVISYYCNYAIYNSACTAYWSGQQTYCGTINACTGVYYGMASSVRTKHYSACACQ